MLTPEAYWNRTPIKATSHWKKAADKLFDVIKLYQEFGDIDFKSSFWGLYADDYPKKILQRVNK